MYRSGSFYLRKFVRRRLMFAHYKRGALLQSRMQKLPSVPHCSVYCYEQPALGYRSRIGC